MKKSTTTFQFSALFMAVLLILSSCTKDPKGEILNTLEGEWEVTSIMTNYSSDTTWFDWLPFYYESFVMEFEEYEDGEGDFEWRAIYTQSYNYGMTETITGEYECNQAGDEIEIIFDGESSGETFEIFLNNDDLILWWEYEDTEYGITTTTSQIFSAKRT